VITFDPAALEKRVAELEQRLDELSKPKRTSAKTAAKRTTTTAKKTAARKPPAKKSS